MSIEPISEVAPGIFRSGQPKPSELSEFRSMGGNTVICLLDSSSASDERPIAEALGMRFIAVSMPGWHAPDEQDMLYCLALLDTEILRPILLHCFHGQDRSGTVVACWRISHGWSVAGALKEAADHHMSFWSFPMRRFIREWERAWHLARKCVHCAWLASGGTNAQQVAALLRWHEFLVHGLPAKH